MAVQQRLMNSDAFAWYMEKDPVLRSTVVGVVRLDRSPDWDVLHERIDRLSRMIPELRRRVSSPAFRLGPPRWTLDESFDLDFHLRRARVGGAAEWPQVLEFARVAAMDDFDRDRPLWEFTLLEGLADGGAAFVTKVHHSLTDGIGAVQLAGLVLDAGPEGSTGGGAGAAGGAAGPLPDERAALDLGVGPPAPSILGRVPGAALSAGRLLYAVPSSVIGALIHPVETGRNALALAESVGRIVAPVNRQFSPVIGQRHSRRVLATLDLPLAELHSAAAAAGGHVNDAYLAALVGGMHRFHRRRGAPLLDIRITVPVSVRRAGDRIGGNRITLVRITVRAAIGDPAERIRYIAEVMRGWRHEPALGHTQGIAFGLNLVPRAYLGGVFKRIEMLASDVPGLDRPAWLAGAKVTGYYPFGPTIGSAVNATLMSYVGTCNVGLNIDTDAIDDPQLLLECVRESAAEIVALARPAATPAGVAAPPGAARRSVRRADAAPAAPAAPGRATGKGA